MRKRKPWLTLRDICRDMNRAAYITEFGDPGVVRLLFHTGLNRSVMKAFYGYVPVSEKFMDHKLTAPDVEVLLVPERVGDETTMSEWPIIVEGYVPRHAIEGSGFEVPKGYKGDDEK